MRTVIFYCESTVSGSHEKMAVMAGAEIRRHGSQMEITWLIDPSNLALAMLIDEAGSTRVAVNLNPTFRWIRNPFSVLKKLFRVKRAFRKLNPDLILLVQGGITNGFDGALAARLAGIPVCSYIPLAQSPLQLGRNLPRLRTAFVAIFFRAIGRYITIDREQETSLRSWQPHAEIAVVENFLPGPIASAPRRPDAKEHIGIPRELTVLAVIGRIHFWQKAQDWLLKALGEGAFLEDKALIFAGDGPDSGELSRLIAKSPRRAHLFQLGWRAEMDSLYEAVDLLLIPSRLEGVPLVMLEALARRIPVVASDRDGMKSWLPAEWRFPFGDGAAMQKAINRALGGRADDHWEAIERRLEIAKDEHRFGVEFGSALAAFSARAAHRE